MALYSDIILARFELVVEQLQLNPTPAEFGFAPEIDQRSHS
jgi:hypothetical protein